jgi:predicted DNA-binding transcriptional regulator YafY
MTDFVPSTLGTLEAIDEGRCLMHIGAYSVEMLAGYLAMFGVDFEVSEPPELVEQIHRMSARFSRAANSQTP